MFSFFLSRRNIYKLKITIHKSSSLQFHNPEFLRIKKIFINNILQISLNFAIPKIHFKLFILSQEMTKINKSMKMTPINVSLISFFFFLND